MLDYGLIGNCTVSALVSSLGSVDWCCLPEPDAEPVLAALLDPDGGRFSVELDGHAPQNGIHGVQRYIENTNILETVLTDSRGNSLRISDFFPWFERNGRLFRPPVLVRRIEPLSGSPEVSVRLSVIAGWRKTPLAARGEAVRQIIYETEHKQPRLLLAGSHPLESRDLIWKGVMREPLVLALGQWGDGSAGVESWSVQEAVSQHESWLSRTLETWRHWVKHCSIPTLFQNETIRAALTLKLHCHEESGAILAALTTSLPEELGGARNWDYRYCWLRDAAFVLQAFHHLGHYEEMEGFLKYLSEIALSDAFRGERGLSPVYSLARETPAAEQQLSEWKGYQGSVPVRVRNQAAEHVQNDVYGEVILALTPIFMDERFRHLRTPEIEALMHRLIELAARSISRKDAGLWEFRDGWREHGFSSLMSWAGLDRAERMTRHGVLRPPGIDVRAEKLRAEQAVLKSVFEGSLRNGPEDSSFDASLLLAPILRFPAETLNRRSVDEIRGALELNPGGPYLYRYRRQDDFGTPRSAFLLCSFWLIQALAATGRKDEGRILLEKVRDAANALGLFSEHYDPATRRQLGNFPQAYSHVGMIQAAFAVSPPWSDIL